MQCDILLRYNKSDSLVPDKKKKKALCTIENPWVRPSLSAFLLAFYSFGLPPGCSIKHFVQNSKFFVFFLTVASYSFSFFHKSVLEN